MPNQGEKAAKKEGEESWRKCPICAQGFKEFLPLIKHVEEHRRREAQGIKVEFGAPDYLQKAITREFLPSIRDAKGAKNRGSLGAAKATKRKFAAEAKGLLAAVADWLEEALMTFPEINNILISDLKVAEQLVGFARRLPDEFRDEREYLLKHQDRLRETGMDPKWLRKPGSQVRFVAESLAGAEWNLSPSTSREFLRQQKPRRGAIPAVSQRWWEPGSTEDSSGEEEK
jgi:hypothetical protein